MLNLTFERRRDSIFRILCLGAHSDDIEIGCGGTVLRILEENPDAEVLWVGIGASGQRADEATANAQSFLARARQKDLALAVASFALCPLAPITTHNTSASGFSSRILRTVPPQPISMSSLCAPKHRILKIESRRLSKVNFSIRLAFHSRRSPPVAFFHTSQGVSPRLNMSVSS